MISLFSTGETQSTEFFVIKDVNHLQSIFMKYICFLQVKLNLQDSWAHASSLKLQIHAKRPLHKPALNVDNIAKQQKDSIIKVSMFEQQHSKRPLYKLTLV